MKLFTVIALIVLISGPLEEAYFDGFYGDRAQCADLRAAEGAYFDDIYGDRAHSADLWAIPGNSFCRYLR